MMQRWSAKNVGPASFDTNAQDGSSRTDEGMKIRLSAFVRATDNKNTTKI